MPTNVWEAKISVSELCISSRTEARSSLIVMSRQVMGSREEWRYSVSFRLVGAVCELVVLEVLGGSMLVILRSLASVRTRLFS